MFVVIAFRKMVVKDMCDLALSAHWHLLSCVGQLDGDVDVWSRQIAV
jgi:hypothetical protein